MGVATYLAAAVGKRRGGADEILVLHDTNTLTHPATGQTMPALAIENVGYGKTESR